MDWETLGYFVYMDEQERAAQQQEDASQNTDSETDGDGES